MNKIQQEYITILNSNDKLDDIADNSTKTDKIGNISNILGALAMGGDAITGI